MGRKYKKGNVFVFKVYDGYDENGKQIVRMKTWRPPSGISEKKAEKLAEEQLILFEKEVKGGRILDSQTTFEEFTNRWMKEYAAVKLADSTRERYEDLLKRILPAIGKLKLEEIRPAHLNEFYRNLSEPGVNLKAKRDKKGRIIKNATLSPKTIKEHHRLISSILSTAVKWLVIAENVALRADPPEVNQNEIKCYDTDEIVNMLKILDKDKFTTIQMKMFFKLLIATGMRRGEACALMWEDIDFDKQTIFIHRAVFYSENKEIIVKPPKTKSSIRKIALSQELLEMLQEYKKWQEGEKEFYGDSWEDLNLVFTNKNGGFIHPDVPTTAFDRFLKRNKLPKVSLHSLRHSNASMCISDGADVRTIASRLGHSTPSTTLKTYSHAFKQPDIAVARSLGRIFLNSKSN